MNDDRIGQVFYACRNYFGASEDGFKEIREFGDGKSGNRVFLIEVFDSDDSKKNGRYVLKVCFEKSVEFMTEIFNTMEMGNLSNCYNGIIFPRYETAGQTEDAFYYIYDVAGNELNNVIDISASMVSGESVLEKLSRDLLLVWNENFTNKQVSISECIKEMVGVNRLEVTGRVATRISNLIVDNLAPVYHYESNVLPNPYYFLNNQNGPLGKQINGVIGKIHGDLNRNNIIINKNFLNNDYEIYLIDYSHYKKNQYLFFDHAYLQLNLLLSSSAAINIFEWYTDLSNVVENMQQTRKNRFISYIYNGIYTFINKYQNKNTDSCWIQFFCSHIAAGLNWMNKRDIDDIHQALCFLYASIFLKKLLILLNYQIEINTDITLSLLGGDKERDIWNKLSQFNTADNRYILITSCDSNTIEKEKFASFLGVKWEGILHLTQEVENEIRSDFIPRLKKRYGIQYKLLPDVNKNPEFEIAPTWCSIQIPTAGALRVWYRQNLQMQMNGLIKSILCIRENEPISIIVDASDWNCRIIEEIITEIQIYSGNAPISVICLNDFDIEVETSELVQVERISYTLRDVASCAAVIFDNKKDDRNVWLPRKSNVEKRREKLYLDDEEVNYISMDFEIVYHGLGWNSIGGDAGERFYHGAEPSWIDIAEHRDIDREDYTNAWKKIIDNRLENLGSSVVSAINLFHRAGAGGTTLSRRILWDFHTQYPCMRMKKMGKGTCERLKNIYDKTKLPILIVAEISAGNITQIDIVNLRIELINKGIRALFICVSRVNNTKIIQYPSNFYLTSEEDMIMNDDECGRMHSAYSKMTTDSKVLDNLRQLTWGDKEEWKELRQPFFYGLFTYGNEYSSISDFIQKSTMNVNDKIYKIILILAFMTQYSQMGLKKIDIQNILDLSLRDEREAEELLDNPLIVYKSVGYQICHPVIAQHILFDNLQQENEEMGLLNYVYEYIDTITGIYNPNSIRLNDILEEIFTHREYYVDEERYKFSNLVMEFSDEHKKEIFLYLIKKLPDNPHYYNHLARVYIYPSEKETHVKIDFDNAIFYAKKAIETSELLENEGVGIHHHLLGKIYTKQCKDVIGHSKFASPVEAIWRKVKPIYEDAEIEFSKCMSGNNMAYGLIGRMELISGILNKFKKTRSSSINAILQREPNAKHEFMQLMERMHRVSVDYSMKFGSDNSAYRHALNEFYAALGNIKQLEQQLKFKGLNLKERLSTRRTLVALEIGNKSNFYNISDDTLQKIFKLINDNIKESADISRHDCIMWFRIYMRMKDFDARKAYEFLMDWPEGDRDYYVCFYRYVLGFVLYYNNELDFLSVERHLKQSNTLARNLYGISATSTRELMGIGDRGAYLIPDNVDSLLGGFNNDEREEYRNEHCVFFEGQISDFNNSMISINFSIDNVHSFIAKIPAVDDINGMNVGDNVKFALGFSYSEMRAWNVKKL